VLKGIQQGLQLPAAAMIPSFAALRDYGNTSCSTTWYVLAYTESCRDVRRGDVLLQVGQGWLLARERPAAVISLYRQDGVDACVSHACLSHAWMVASALLRQPGGICVEGAPWSNVAAGQVQRQTDHLLVAVLQCGMGGGMEAGVNIWRALRGNRCVHPTWTHLAGKPLTEEDLPRGIEAITSDHPSAASAKSSDRKIKQVVELQARAGHVAEEIKDESDLVVA
jgi:hypothetical protein